VSKEEVTELLAPLSDPSNPWHYMVQEILGYADYRNGDMKAALTSFQNLAKQPDAPAGIRARANAMATFITAGGARDVGTVPPLPHMPAAPSTTPQAATPQKPAR